ncbi:hypothetical protein B4065_0188 [Caldibacillus thermoamylovorans]|nr:hypothetical protein B4065_0188 [Caldibacillus thermoamylovorans]
MEYSFSSTGKVLIPECSGPLKFPIFGGCGTFFLIATIYYVNTF